EVEQHLDERSGVHPDLVGEVAQRRAAGQADDLAVAARDRHAADRRGLHVVEFLTALRLRLATARGAPAGPAERALRAAATAAAGTRRAHARPPAPATAARSPAAGATGTAAAAAAAPGARPRAGSAARTGATRSTGTAAHGARR